jgi:hypothetical protein
MANTPSKLNIETGNYLSRALPEIVRGRDRSQHDEHEDRDSENALNR